MVRKLIALFLVAAIGLITLSSVAETTESELPILHSHIGETYIPGDKPISPSFDKNDLDQIDNPSVPKRGFESIIGTYWFNPYDPSMYH